MGNTGREECQAWMVFGVISEKNPDGVTSEYVKEIESHWKIRRSVETYSSRHDDVILW